MFYHNTINIYKFVIISHCQFIMILHVYSNYCAIGKTFQKVLTHQQQKFERERMKNFIYNKKNFLKTGQVNFVI